MKRDDILRPAASERGAAPVIGIALMIGIVVLVGGTIGMTVLDFGDTDGPEPQAAVDVDPLNETHVRVTWVTSGNADYIAPTGFDVVDAGPAADEIAVHGVAPDISAEVAGGDDRPGLTAVGQWFVVEFGAGVDEHDRVGVLAAIADEPEDTATLIEEVERE